MEIFDPNRVDLDLCICPISIKPTALLRYRSILVLSLNNHLTPMVLLLSLICEDIKFYSGIN